MKNYKQSRKQENWKRYSYLFNENKKLTFMCQCGKKYVSFPGLYLHTQRKHGHKISTKFSQKECQVIQNGDKMTYRYKIGVKQKQKQDYLYAQTFQSEKQSVSAVLLKFSHFLDECMGEQPVGGNLECLKKQIVRMMTKFQSFMFQIIEQDRQIQNTKQILSSMPYHFNKFVAKHADRSNPTQYGKICAILYEMGKWLNKEGYSDLIVQFNQSAPSAIDN